MQNQLCLNEEILSNISSLSKPAIGRLVEEVIKLVEREYSIEFQQKYKRPIDDPGRIHLRKAVLKMCRDYMVDAIETMEYYQEI